MIRFRNWILTGEIDARQYDDYTAEFRVVGLPLGWVKWELFWNFGSHLDVFDLSMDESGTAGTVLLNKDNLAFAGIYRAQLLATNAAGGEKHTDTLELDIHPSFSEDANWPEIPSSFQDYVDSVGEQIGEKVNEIAGENISDEINEHNIDDQAHSEKFENVLRALDLALTRHNINTNSHEDIRTLITNLSKAISGFETTSGASAKVSAHNADGLAHSDIRDLISTLTTRLNAVANSEDIDLDQLAELVAYIKANRGLIESITTTKVSYSDIVNDLDTNDARKPLSAQMGAELKKMIETGGGSGNVFIGTEQTPLAEYKEAFDSGKACFMLRDRGTSKVMYTICQVTNNVVHLARTASSGLVEFGALSASGVLSFQIVSYATEITETNTKDDNYVPTAKAVKDAIDGNATELKNWVQDGYAQMDDLPTVPEWASKDQKPSYTKSEVGLGNVDDVRQYSADNPPPYPVSSVNGKTGAVSLGASDVGARPNTWTPTYSDVGADKSGTAASAVSTHNTQTDAHNDIRLLITALVNRLDALANSDDETLDQMAEVVAYIKNNRDLIDQITTGKVSVSDIVNNLTTNVANKPLSAAQGVALKALIDAIVIPTKLSQLANDKGYITGYTETDPTVPAWAKAEKKPTYTAEEVGALSADSLPGAVNDALTQAKASGEFDGKDGYTPQRDVDYWTEADQEAIVQQVIAALGTPVFGTVDANKVINMTGELVDGTYTFKYTDKDGTSHLIGTYTQTSAPTYTNVLPLSINSDGTPYVGANGEKGYKTDTRLSSSGGESTSNATGMEVTGFLPVTWGDTLYFDGIEAIFAGTNADKCYFVAYDSSFGLIAYKRIDSMPPNNNAFILDSNNNVKSLHLVNGGGFSANIDNIAYLRFSATEINANSIVTKNEPIE